MRSRNMVITTVVTVVVAAAIFGTVAYGIYVGLTQSHYQASPSGIKGAVVSGSLPSGFDASSSNGSGANQAAAAPNAPSGASIAQPAPGVFMPGGPPYGQSGLSGDGISGWGVAYRETTDANAQPDAALIKAAYQDAEKKVNDLGSATGVKVGKLLAMTDYGVNQPYYRGCIEPAQGKPVPAPAASGATGSSGSGNATVVPPIAPVPCQVNNSHYVVVWVFVRHAIG